MKNKIQTSFFASASATALFFFLSIGSAFVEYDKTMLDFGNMFSKLTEISLAITLLSGMCIQLQMAMSVFKNDHFKPFTNVKNRQYKRKYAKIVDLYYCMSANKTNKKKYSKYFVGTK
ncbi:MAG: hypothetical protein MJZ96_01725 [Paludibacteraceae bacterium]|nr:hypothetical protein [Paludibacteraceae bacterium]